VRLDPETAAEPLRLALADEAPGVRVAAATALGASSTSEVLEDLQRLLVDEDARVCAAAVRGIGTYCAAAPLRDPGELAQALELLASALREPVRGGMVAMAALEALEAIGGPEAGRVAASGLASDEPEVVQAAVACVGRHADADTVCELIALVQHPSWAVRGEAIQTLAERRVPRALPAILRRLETEQDSFVRDVIVRALRRLEG
jgi:HEAT repeat protein